MKISQILILLLSLLYFASCDSSDINEDNEERKITFSFTFDESMPRLNNLGLPSEMPINHSALNPSFNAMSAHFIELVPTKFTPYQSGAEIYKGREVETSNTPLFDTAIDFDNAAISSSDHPFAELPLKDVEPGTYNHIRVSVSYQNYDVKFNLNNIPFIGNVEDASGTISSFVGYNTRINDLLVKDKILPVNDSKLQGFWAFETDFEGNLAPYNQVLSGQAPANSTTVVNPFPDSPISQGSCVVSGSFVNPLTITGNEEEDLHVVIKLSTNNSFEWEDKNGNGKWDIDAADPTNSERVVDMGLRGMSASF